MKNNSHLHRVRKSGPVFRRGSALVLALWSLFFLSALALAVGSHVEAGIRIARRVKQGVRGRCSARAGVERAVMTLLSDTNGWDSLSEEWSRGGEALGDDGDGEWIFSLLLADDPDLGRYLPSEVWDESGNPHAVTNSGLIDEESKLNINTAERDLLARFIEIAGGADSITSESVASSIVDWRDADGDQLPAGAEEGYYRTMSPSRSCANRPMKSIHELLLVKGVDEGLFLKLRPFSTVYGSGKVNLNTADPVVLRSLALYCGGDHATADSIARKIERFRRSGGVFDEANAMLIVARFKADAIVVPEEEAVLTGMLGHSAIRSTCFRGMSFAKNVNGDIKTISFVYDREKRTRLYWRE